MRTKINFSLEQIKKMRVLRKEGFSLYDIARVYKTTAPTINSYLRKYKELKEEMMSDAQNQ